MDLQCPPEIVQKILLNLHRVDLLNSRLVSQTWNKESMRALNSSRCMLTLNETNLGEYVEFSRQQSQTSLFHIPFKLNFTFGKEPLEQEQEQQQSTEAEKFKETISKVETLVDIFGPKCVRVINFYIYANAQELVHFALKLLALISQGLKTLGVWIYAPLGNGNQEDFFKDCPNLNLPKVECLLMYSKMDPNTMLWPKLAEKCPNLVEVQMLKFSSSLQDEYWPIPLNSAKIKYLVSTGSIPLSSISSKICNSPWSSNLTWLQFVINANFIHNQSDVTHLQNMLDHLSKTLVDLHLSFHAYQYQDESILIPCTTKFHRLKYLSIYIYMNSNVKCPNLMIDPSAFPNLEKATLPYCMKLELTKGMGDPEGSDPDGSDPDPFPKVKSLTLRVREDLGLIPTNPYKDHIEGLQNIFQHVTNVKVMNSSWDCSYERNGGSKVMYVIEGIITSAGANKITELTLDDFQENYLGIVLNQMEKPPRLVVENLPRNFYLDPMLKKTFEKLTGCINLLVIDQKENEEEKTIVVQQNPTNIKDNFNMWNLKKLRLMLNSWRKSTWDETFIPPNSADADPTTSKNLMDIPTELYVKTLVKNFPLLEQIHVSSFMFGKDKKVRTQVLQKIAKECPNIVVDVI